jgi:hypothetical protein
MMDITTKMAWREDTRRNTMKENLNLLLGSVFQRGKSQWRRGYWQAVNHQKELLWVI